MMSLKIQLDCSNINWDIVSQTLKIVGMASFTAEIHKKAFENSHTVVFIFDDDKLIGFGRALSDGAYQAAIYDIAISPGYQGKLQSESFFKGCDYILSFVSGPGIRAKFLG